MKFLFVLNCFLVVTYAAIPPELMEKFKEKLHMLKDDCKGEVGASDDDVAPMLKHEPPTTDKGKCFVACINKKMGFQDKSGKIDKAESLKMIEKIKSIDEELYGKVKKVAEICLTEVSDAANECETAHNMYICIKREKTAAGLELIDF